MAASYSSDVDTSRLSKTDATAGAPTGGEQVEIDAIYPAGFAAPVDPDAGADPAEARSALGRHSRPDGPQQNPECQPIKCALSFCSGRVLGRSRSRPVECRQQRGEC